MKFVVAEAIALLQRTPASLQALLGGLGAEWVRGDEGPDTFSAFDVVGHLIDGEETDWLPRARLIREAVAGREPPRFEPYDRFRHRQRNRERSLASLLAEFAELRAANLEVLASWQLGDADLERPADHPSLGRVNLRQLLSAWVVHDLGHLAQAARVMAKQYKEEVGPWVPFLPVLTDRETPRS